MHAAMTVRTECNHRPPITRAHVAQPVRVVRLKVGQPRIRSERSLGPTSLAVAFRSCTHIVPQSGTAGVGLVQACFGSALLSRIRISQLREPSERRSLMDALNLLLRNRGGSDQL